MYDAIIIGAGPAGLTAGIYCTRSGLNTVCFEKSIPGGQMIYADVIENYPGFPKGVEAPILIENLKTQAERFGLKILKADIQQIENRATGSKSTKVIRAKDAKEYEAPCLIIATGASPTKLQVPGEARLIGKGVSYCATCDGPLFRNKKVLVVGGGDKAISEALFLANFCESVVVIHRRDKLRATKILQERAKNNPKIEFMMEAIVIEIIGKEKVEKAKLKLLNQDKEIEILCEGIFVFVGIKPNSEILEGLPIQKDEKGHILTDENMQTNVAGIFACGDVRKKLLYQIVTAAGDGAIAGFNAHIYLEKIKAG